MRHRLGSRRFQTSVAGAILSMLLLTSATSATDAQALTPSSGPVAIEVTARPIAYFDQRDSSRVRFGDLEFISGLALTSSFRGFGGLSALRLDPKGERFTSLSDKGDWFTGRLVYHGKLLTGLADVETAPILGPDGGPVAKRGWFDTESLAIDGTTAYVGIERVNQILRFEAFGRDGLRAHGEPMTAPPALRRLPFNKGLESLVVVPRNLPLGGTLLAISERGLDPAGNLLAFMLGGPSPGQFTIRRSNNFDISDAAVLPSGALLVLERKFSIVAGVGIRIRRIPLVAIAPDRLVDGPVIFEADLGNEVDNMEGLDVHQAPDGSTIVSMISDDNFSLIQRTLLLQFKLVEP